MATYTTLKSALLAFRQRGDERWAAKADVPTDEEIEATVTTKVQEAVSDLEVTIESLTDTDMDEIFGVLDGLDGPGSGE